MLIRNKKINALLSFVLLLLATRAWLDPVFDQSKEGGGVGLGGVLNVAVLLLGFFAFMSFRAKKNQRIFILWLPVLFLSGVSVLYAPVFFDSLRAYLGWVTYFVMFLLGYISVRNSSDVQLVAKAVYFSYIITAIFSIYQLLSDNMYYSEDIVRINSAFNHPNIYAFYLVFVISIALYFLVTNQEYERFSGHKWVIFSGLIFLMMTQTRSAWIGMLMVFMVYFYFNNKKLFFLIVMLLPLTVFLPVVGDRLADVLSGQGGEEEFLYYYERMNSYVWRKVVWGAAWQEIMNRPILGHGYNSFSYYFLDFFPYGADQGMDAHNSYVQIAFDSGLIAALFYVVLIFGVLYLFLKMLAFDRRGVSVIVGLVIFYIAAGYSDNVTFYLNFNWYYWFFIGMFLRVYLLSCERSLMGRES